LVHPGKGEAVGQGYGRVALVSAGSRGIGAATVARLAADGWDVSFCYSRDEEFAVEAEKAASELGARVLAVQADATEAAEVTFWVRQAEDLGPVGAVVSCAGISRDRPLAQLEHADWRAVTDTSLDGLFHLCQAVLPAMMKRRSGRIVAVSSVCGVYGPAAGSPAAGSPAAGSPAAASGAAESGAAGSRTGVARFTRALANQTAPYGIRVNALVPAAVSAEETAIWPEGTRAPVTEMVALRRFASAAAVAGRVAFLLSDAAADLTGAVLEVPGGIEALGRSWPGSPGSSGRAARRGGYHGYLLAVALTWTTIRSGR
jgi:3-oxoacyl-[acyl-carrier protein] reductase